MARYLFFAFLMLHGSFHLMGLFTPVLGRVLVIDRSPGIYWALCSMLFWLTAVLMILHQRHWVWVALVAVSCSQLLIASAWQQARFGTILNVIIIAVLLVFLFFKDVPFLFRD
jgi:hypothetical protein